MRLCCWVGGVGDVSDVVVRDTDVSDVGGCDDKTSLLG